MTYQSRLPLLQATVEGVSCWLSTSQWAYLLWEMAALNEEKERTQALMWVQRDHSDVLTTCSKEGPSHPTLLTT